MTNHDVIEEFQDGFSPIITHMHGFQRYTAATTGNALTVFFMNAFATKDEACAAQEAAQLFVTEGRLNGTITPNQFTEDVIVSYFNAKECVAKNSTAQYLSTRLYNLPQGMTLEPWSTARRRTRPPLAAHVAAHLAALRAVACLRAGGLMCGWRKLRAGAIEWGRIKRAVRVAVFRLEFRALRAWVAEAGARRLRRHALHVWLGGVSFQP